MFQVASHPSAFGLHSHGQYSSANRASSAPQSVVGSSVQLPRTLTRPKFTEVSPDAIRAAAPELAGVPHEYVRRGLRGRSQSMLAGLNALSASHVPPSLPRSHLPSSLTVPLRSSGSSSSSSSSEITCPTHVLAISPSRSHSSSSEQVSLFPVHALTLAANCALLPPLPPSQAAPAPNGTVTLQVLPLSLPSPPAFSVIHSYLYTHRLDAVMKALFPLPAGFLQNLTHDAVCATLDSGDALHQLSAYLCSSASGNLRTLTNHAAHVKELWQDLAALGLFEEELWDTLDLAWEILLGALNLAAAASNATQ